MKPHRLIYTLGTSNRSAEDLFSILKTHGIGGILDVRRFPKSSRFPHFNRDNLESEAKNRDVLYTWLGELLGGFRKGGYEEYKKETGYIQGLERLEHLAENCLSVIICAEKLPWKCHRLHISKSLTELGWDVIHIIDEGRTWQPKNE